MTENEISRIIIGAAIEVHKHLGGPGLLEDVYEECLCEELRAKGLQVERQVRVPVVYKGKKLNKSLTLDVLVGGKVIVEVKAAEQHNSIFEVQLLTYLRLTGKKLGLAINFGQKMVTSGIKRVVNGL